MEQLPKELHVRWLLLECICTLGRDLVWSKHHQQDCKDTEVPCRSRPKSTDALLLCYRIRNRLKNQTVNYSEDPKKSDPAHK